MFKITSGKGFHITFENGWTASVQFGPGNYGDNKDMPIGPEGDVEAGKRGSSRAEIAAWDTEKHWHEFDNDTVAGYQSPADVLAFLNEVAAKPRAEV